MRWPSRLCLLALVAARDLGEVDFVSLLQQQIRLSATASAQAANDTIYFLHIPKNAGTSFGVDAMHILAESGLKIISREGCYSWGEHAHVRGTALLLRDPRKLPHDFAEFVQGWAELLDQGWHGDFTPPAEPMSSFWYEALQRRKSIDAWAKPPFSAETSTLHMQDWPHLNGGGSIWQCTQVPYQCYPPVSLQAQRLSCSRSLDYSAMPSAQTAIENMQGAWFVGIVEAYQASTCLFHAKLSQKLPAYCDCTKPELWATFPGQEQNSVEHQTKIEDLPSELLGLVDKLTVVDRQLYKAGRVRFLREIAEVEEQHGVRMLCGELKQQLEA